MATPPGSPTGRTSRINTPTLRRGEEQDRFAPYVEALDNSDAKHASTRENANLRNAASPVPPFESERELVLDASRPAVATYSRAEGKALATALDEKRSGAPPSGNPGSGHGSILGGNPTAGNPISSAAKSAPASAVSKQTGLAPVSLPRAGEVQGRVVHEVDVAALVANAALVRDVGEAEYQCQTIAVLKADAYGHGAVSVGRILRHAKLSGFFAVATLPEALELRAASFTERVVILGPTDPSEWSLCAKHAIEIVVDSAETAKLLLARERPRPGGDPGGGSDDKKGAPPVIKVHVMLNTGMNRIGLATFESSAETHGPRSNASRLGDAKCPLLEHASVADIFGADLQPPPPPAAGEPSAAPKVTYLASGCDDPFGDAGVLLAEAAGVVAQLASPRALREAGVALEGLCTHMCDAFSETAGYTVRQFERFKGVVDATRRCGIEIPCLHVANSETLLQKLLDPVAWKALLVNPRTGYRTKGFARVGGALYGQRSHPGLQPVSSLRAQVRFVHRCGEGMTVGYDRSWVAPHECRIATLACGFADGYARDNSSRGRVGIRGGNFTVAGKVCMDQLMVYLGPTAAEEEEEEEATEGGKVEEAAAGTPEGLFVVPDAASVACGRRVRVGDYATLWGVGGPSLKDCATLLATCESDLTCGLSRRVARRYVSIPEGCAVTQDPSQADKPPGPLQPTLTTLHPAAPAATTRNAKLATTSF
eukprot:CAMPEP_0172644458 /NCGR_PEP_ID=MMETSP1068-20121228/239222_1 /TAXON_ID=35684 /ORGANISM="Pseudopedinella elastica, Strain CCMP716" /LENGTH=711 /DNA_ID=CAMNT_0013458657 /DNA_START=106 /DNA_END=2241 /DNA_ORIENTATION=+